MVVVSLSLDNDLMKRFDKIWNLEGYKNRSEAMRTSIRDFIYKHRLESIEDGEIVEIRIIFSYHDTKTIRTKIEQIEHSYDKFIMEKHHKHISNDLCFDTLTLHGENKQLIPLIGRLRSIRGIETLNTIILPIIHNHEI